MLTVITFLLFKYLGVAIPTGWIFVLPVLTDLTIITKLGLSNG